MLHVEGQPQGMIADMVDSRAEAERWNAKGMHHPWLVSLLVVEASHARRNRTAGGNAVRQYGQCLLLLSLALVSLCGINCLPEGYADSCTCISLEQLHSTRECSATLLRLILVFADP